MRREKAVDFLAGAHLVEQRVAITAQNAGDNPVLLSAASLLEHVFPCYRPGGVIKRRVLQVVKFREHHAESNFASGSASQQQT